MHRMYLLKINIGKLSLAHFLSHKLLREKASTGLQSLLPPLVKAFPSTGTFAVGQDSFRKVGTNLGKSGHVEEGRDKFRKVGTC